MSNMNRKKTVHFRNSKSHLRYLFGNDLLQSLDAYPHRVYIIGRQIPPQGMMTTHNERGVKMSDSKDCCACSEKHKERRPEEYKDLINRLSRIEGQVRGIKAMVERGAYCPDILIQTSAVNSALNSFSKVLLSNHIRTCVRNDIREGNDEVVEELVATLQKMMK